MGDLIVFMEKRDKNDINYFKEDLYEIGDFLKPYLVNNEDTLSIVEQAKSVVKRLADAV